MYKKFCSLILIFISVTAVTLTVSSFDAVTAKVTETFDGYGGLSGSALENGLKDAGWSRANAQFAQTGTVYSIEETEGYYGMPTNALHIKKAATEATAAGPSLGGNNLNFSGKTVLGFKIKLMDTTVPKRLVTTEWLSAPVSANTWTFPIEFNYTPGVGDYRFYGEIMPALQTDRWYDFTLTTEIMGSNNGTMTLYIDGVEIKKKNNVALGNAAASYGNITLEFNSSDQSPTKDMSEMYLDDIFIRKESSYIFDNTVSVPANNSEDVPVSTRDICIYFNDILDNASRDLLNGGVTVYKESGGNPPEPVSGVTASATLNKVTVSFPQDLDMSAFYTVELPDGVKNIMGNLFPGNKKKLIFATENDPGLPVPDVSVTSPANNTRIDPGGSVTFRADAYISGGSIANVIFFSNGAEIGRTAVPPYSFEWTNVQEGNYIITCKAFSDAGVGKMSGPVALYVIQNASPEVSVTAPVNGAEAAVSSSVALTADANDRDGEIKEVQFYINGALAGTAVTKPYAVSWTPPEPGQYICYAIAYDMEGANKKSGIVTFNAIRKGEMVILDNDFSGYTANKGNNAPPNGFTLALGNGDEMYSTVIDQQRGQSVYLASNRNIEADGTPAELFYSLAAVGTGKLDVECEAYFTSTERKYNFFAVRSSQAQWNTDLSFEDDGTIRLLNAAGGLKRVLAPYQVDKWYRINQIFDLDTKRYDLYIYESGQLVCGVTNEGFANAQLNDIPRLTITNTSRKAVSGAVVIDNYKIKRYFNYPKISGLSFEKEDGSKVTGTAPVDTKKIIIKFDAALQASGIDSYISLVKYDQSMPVEYMKSYDSGLREYTIIPLTDLEPSMRYIARVRKGLKTTDNIELSDDLVSEFRTACGGAGVKDTAVLLNGAPIYSAYGLNRGSELKLKSEMTNNSDGALNATVILALYKDGKMVKAVTKTNSVPANTGSYFIETESILIPEEDYADDIKIFIWDGLGSRMALMAEVQL
jgi:hypothetical protein